ncbi:TPA: rhodanese-like domain-containing protein, partial [Klebsiella pneumoniae]|nr:rhodanese-like domain-containing protein [Klebsiella pneumoniae]
MSVVTQFTPATSAEAIRWFSHKLHLETDCADVHSAQRAGEVDFVLLHVVGSEEAFARRHLPGAQHLPHSQITAERMAAWPAETLFVVYCAGPHCNGADVAALKLAELG